MAQLRSPTLVTLGRMVRTFRDAAGLTQKEFAKKLGYTNGWVSNVENAQLRPRSEQVTAMERSLGVPPGALMNIYEQLDGEFLPGWFREWVDEETRAEVLRTFQLVLVPGLLQTEDYARALFPDDAATVAHRMKRQEILARDAPPMFHVVLDEAVLYQGRGGKEVIRAQLERLIASVGPHLTLQVVPSDVNPRSAGAFTIATVDGDDVAYIETAVRGIVTSSREELAALTASWEAIRTFALSQRDSLDLIRKVIEEKWT
jgi:transcriptional regulator with XRE-family HTH domain